MSSTGRLSLPYIVTAQAQKEVTHNDGLNRLDAFVTPVVADIASAPPGSPAEGDLYIVGASATGAFAGKEDNLAQYLTGGGTFSNLSEVTDDQWSEIRNAIRKTNNKDKKDRS